MLLVDEVDRVELETEALLLEVLSEYQVSIPELGTIRAQQIPLVFLTSNNTRELSEALKRRCLYLHLDYPSLERERDIVLARVPGVTEELADQMARIVRSLRTLELKKYPSVSETLDWARTLVVLGVESIDAEQAKATLARAAQVPQRPRAGGQGTGRGRGGPGLRPSRRARRPHRLRRRAAGRRPAGVADRVTSTPPRPSTTSRSRTATRSSTRWRPPWSSPRRTGRRSRPPSRSTSRCGARSTKSATTSSAPTPTPTATPRARAAARAGARAAGAGRALSPEELAEMLFRALLAANDAQVAALARQAVSRFAGHGAGPSRGGHLLPVPDAAEPRPRRVSSSG